MWFFPDAKFFIQKLRECMRTVRLTPGARHEKAKIYLHREGQELF